MMISSSSSRGQLLAVENKMHVSSMQLNVCSGLLRAKEQSKQDDQNSDK
jgi:hypothetical protein